MFMFRMIIYLYELKHAEEARALIDTLGYFFLLPNYCFLHFPVVDYRTLQRGYFAGDVHATQRARAADDVPGDGPPAALPAGLPRAADPGRGGARPGDAWRATWSCNYLLYLRVSGQFHMACGMLHLFGYQLPETHHHYLLATGFTDYWRRINIYWKDFMVRVVFNPVVFRLKRWPQPAALAAATVVVFADDLGAARLPVVLAAGHLGLQRARRPVLGHPGPAGAGQRPARRPRARPRHASRATAPTSPGSRAVRVVKTAGTFTTHRPALVALVEPERRRLARPCSQRGMRI